MGKKKALDWFCPVYPYFSEDQCQAHPQALPHPAVVAVCGIPLFPGEGIQSPNLLLRPLPTLLTKPTAFCLDHSFWFKVVLPFYFLLID